MDHTSLIITSIARPDHPILKQFAEETLAHNVQFIVVGDTKSPAEFSLPGCDFYSIERQRGLAFALAKDLPVKHYARKNLGYLVAMANGAAVIIETDDDNRPLSGFWETREKTVNAHLVSDKGWVNMYKYFTDTLIWPRGFALEHIHDALPALDGERSVVCPIQQGLADENPDVDAIYRLLLPLPFSFNKSANIALGSNAFCPFNSQNTTWFKEAFPLLYLPSYCSFRMTDIWRSFIAQRIAWTCGWPILFHHSTVWQERNDHDLMRDFRDEITGYTNNGLIYESLKQLPLADGVEHIHANMMLCYRALVDLGLVGEGEINLLEAWNQDIRSIMKN